MGEEIKDVNKKVDEMESAVKKYASKDTVISIENNCYRTIRKDSSF